MELEKILKHIQGLTFQTIGPFFVADLSKSSERMFNNIPVGEHGMEEVGQGTKTQSHTHLFSSFYKSVGLNIESNGKKYTLPERALTLVLPEVAHSWITQNEIGKVGSVDTRHEKQVMVAA